MSMDETARPLQDEAAHTLESAIRDRQDAARYRAWVASHHYWRNKKEELDALLDRVMK